MSKIKNNFQLVFPENQKRDGNLSTTDSLAFDDLGDFIEERGRIKREAQRLLETDLRIDYSNFANHVFFDSAVSKLGIAKSRTLNQYPFNGNREEKDAFHLTGSGYDKYIFGEWPREESYVEFDGVSQHISASDGDNKLLPVTSSVYVSAWVNLATNHTATFQYPIVSWHSGSNTDVDIFVGWRLYCDMPSAGDDPEIKFSVMSGTLLGGGFVTTSASLAGFTGSWICVAGEYDVNAGWASVYINESKVASSSTSFGSLEVPSQKVYIASASFVNGATNPVKLYSGSIGEVRIAHTASTLWHSKNYSRAIDSEDYLKLRYSFNEGFVGSGSIDSVIVDYAKSGLHGTYIDYSVDSSRISGSSITSGSGDPILYSFHSRVVNFTSSLENSASLYDDGNNNQISNMVPESLRTEDENASGLYGSFLLAMARFFDEIKFYVDQLDNLRITNYDSVNDSPDLFLPMVQKYFGWKVSEHFGDASPLSFMFGENILSSGSLDISLLEVKNQFWRRTLNNLPYLLKTKGKRHGLDAYFNVLGINRENITLKEYGYLPGSSIQDTRIHKEKVSSLLGIGTGSFGVLSSSYVKATASISTALSSYTVETFAQLPYFSASYSGSLYTGSVWQFVDPEQLTGSFTLLWNVPSLGSTTGKFILTSSDGQEFSSSEVAVFDGDFVYIAAGLDSSQLPFIEIKTLDNDEIDFTGSYTGSTALSGVFTGSKFDFVMGSNSGSTFLHETQGFYGQYRIWNRALSASELTNHAFHFENVGINNPNEEPHPLLGHWALNENISSTDAGLLGPLTDLSRKNLVANGAEFPVSENPYHQFLIEYNYLSPSIDLKWSENKIRIRNKTELTIDDVASDTNEVSLEFNLIESLNEDITKIFSTFDILNNVIGNPINKYRDEYADLESMRRVYFERLGDSIHFTKFFKLFKWFDRKLSNSIKQLLPARVRFFGGEQVVESHVLERPKYGYKYPKFRTPQDVPEGIIRGTFAESKRDADNLSRGYSSASYGLHSDYGDTAVVVDGQEQKVLPEGNLSPVYTATSQKFREDERLYFNDKPNQIYLTASELVPNSLVSISGSVMVGSSPTSRVSYVSVFSDGINEKRINADSRLTSWVERANASFAGGLWAVAHDQTKLWVITGQSGEIETSPDGITWTARTADGGFSGYFNGVAYNGSNLWCIVGQSGEIQISANGTTGWGKQTQDGAYAGMFQAVAHNGSNLWCIVGQSGEIQTSADGETWAAQSADGGYSSFFYGVAYNGSDLWCIVGQSGEIQISADGETWAAQLADGGYSSRFNGVAHNGSNLWCIVGNIGEIQTSADGETWTARTSNTTEHLYSVVYDSSSGVWLASGWSGTVLSSVDGISWTDVSSATGTTVDLRALAYNGSNLWAAVSNNGNIFTRTGDPLTWLAPHLSFAKSSGDQHDSIYDPNSGVNFRNERAKESVTNSDRDGDSFRNKKLGNSFSMKSTNSTQNQEHWFGGHKKHVRLRWNALSGNSTDLGNKTNIEKDFTITGAEDGLALSASLYDANDTLYLRGDSRGGFAAPEGWIQDSFGIDPTAITKVSNLELTCFISSSTGPFNVDEFDIKIVKTTPGVWESIKPYGTFRDATDEEIRTTTGSIEDIFSASSGHAFKKFTFNYGTLYPTTNNGVLMAVAPFIVISSSAGKSYTFRKMQFDFDVPLTDEGVKRSEDWDNQNTEKISSFMNVDVLKKVE